LEIVSLQRVVAAGLVGAAAGCGALLAIPDSLEFGGESRDAASEVSPVEASTGPFPTGTEDGGRGCKPICATNLDCCATATVEAGTFSFAYDGAADGQFNDPSTRVTVSAFDLDVFEVTVGRFRAFVADYRLPNPNTQPDAGWNPSWDAGPTDSASMLAELASPGCDSLWSELPGANDDKPITCVTWYEAFAFCVWDGGRLPTEVEWNYAAAGGDWHRAYPWSKPPTNTAIDETYAVYKPDGGTKYPSMTGLTYDKGHSRWGHSDLAGNAFEWVRDTFGDPPPSACGGCVDDGNDPVIRGGSFEFDPITLRTAFRRSFPANQREPSLGFRCARP
jgi:formylglycine-generating enzyme required for sulfatase activity